MGKLLWLGVAVALSASTVATLVHFKVLQPSPVAVDLYRRSRALFSSSQNYDITAVEGLDSILLELRDKIKTAKSLLKDNQGKISFLRDDFSF